MSNSKKATQANITKMSKFEATMFACQKAKALKENKTTKKNTKVVTESRSMNKKRIKAQNKKVENALRRRRVVEEEEYDPEIDDELPEDTVDDAVLVIDPELDAEEFEDNLDDLQTIINDTPEGEVPSTDEYVNDFVYTCPICGNNFFSDTEMTGDEPCPVCGEEVDEFILVGDIESPEEALGADEEDEDIVDDADEDLDVDEDIDEDLDADVDVDDIEDVEECLTKDAKTKDNGPAIKKESYAYLLDEKTLNPFLTKFIKENYKNTVSMKAIGAKVAGKTLKIECQIRFKSGASKKTTISLEGFTPSMKKKTFKAKADSAFKVESKTARPFTFEAFTRGKIIKFTGMNYSFITKKEGKRVQIYGKYALKG